MKTVSLSKYNNQWYKKEIGAGLIKRVTWYFINLIVASRLNPFSSLKRFMLKAFGARVGKGVVIKPGVNIKYPWKLVVGDFSWIGEKVWIDNLDMVIIGNNVCISQGAMLLTGNHDYRTEGFELKLGAITIEDGAWIGAQSMVCPGVTVLSHAVLMVNSVATRNLEAWCVYQGNPAIKIKERTIL